MRMQNTEHMSVSIGAVPHGDSVFVQSETRQFFSAISYRHVFHGRKQTFDVYECIRN